MRYLIIGLSFLLPALPAQATVIELGPNFYIDSIEGPSFAIENFVIGTRTTNTSASGSGSALSIVNDWDDAEIRTTLGTGPGEATASLINSATFDLVFDGPGFIEVVFGFGLDGLGDAGVFDIDSGDNGFAFWDMSIDVEGFPDLIGERQELQCPVVANCFNFFDFSEIPLFTTLTDDLRLSVSTNMRFDIGVSRAAVAAPEPGALAMLLMSLVWIGRKTLVASRAY